MHHQDQTKTHTPGPENHGGVYLCHKCGWPFPNPHPSSKTRRAHKKICGTIQGYNDDDFKTPCLVVSRSEDEVFSDAVADFSDGGQSLRVMDSLQHSLSGSSEYSDFNAADESPLIANLSNDCQIKNPKILQSESFEVENIVGLQGQFSGSIVDPLTSSIADSKTEEPSIVHGDGFPCLSSDSTPIEAEAVPDELPEKSIYGCENVTDCSLIYDEKDSNLKESDVLKSERDMVENAEPTDNIVGETCEGPSQIVVGDATSLDHKLCQVESAHVIQEKEDMNINIDPLLVHDDILDVAYPRSESLKHKDGTEENSFHYNTSQLCETSGVISSDTHVMGSNMKTEAENIHVEDCSDVSLVEPSTEAYQSSHEIGVSMKLEMNENCFSEEYGPEGIHENSQPENSLMVSSNEIQRESSFRSATEETFNIINISDHPNDTTEINDASVDENVGGANVVNDTEVITKDFKPNDLLQSEVEQSSNLLMNNSDNTVLAINEDTLNIHIKLHEEHNKAAVTAADSHEEQDAQLLVKTAEDSSSKHSSHSSTKTEPSTQHDSAVEDQLSGDHLEDQISNNFLKLGSSLIDASADSHEVQDAQLLVKATEDFASKHTTHSSINTETSAHRDSAVEDDSGGEASITTAVPLSVQDQTSPGAGASVDSGSRRDSLYGNWGSSSVILMISNAPAVINAETLPSTGSLASTEAGKSSSNIPEAASADKQLSGKSETFELPSFSTLVEPNCVASTSNDAASEIQNTPPSDSTSQAGWFPTLNQVINESQGKKKNEETITRITNQSSSDKEHTPLKSLLGEATHSSKKPKSPRMEEKNNGSGLTTVNSILGPESPSAAKGAKGEASNERNSPARYPANIKREKKKLKSRPFWIQLVCCSTLDPQRR